MWFILLPAAALGLFLALKDKNPVLANGAINKTNKPTTLFAPGFQLAVANLPKGETITVLGSGMVSPPNRPDLRYVVASRQGGATGLVLVSDLSGI